MVKILIAEDDRDIVEVLKIALSRENYEVDYAYDGKTALEKISKNKPDLVILDIMLPEIDGGTVNLKLKENPSTKNIPVIVITGKANVKELLNLREGVTVSAYFEKPVPIKMVLDKIKSLV